MQTKAGSCPKLVSETLHSLQGHAGVSEVRSKFACVLWELGGKGFVLLMEGQTAWPTGQRY